MASSQNKLFALYLGGRAPKCNTELHDVVFAVGTHVEATYEQALSKWFGELPGLHIDSFIELQHVDGYRVELRAEPALTPHKLYFVNLGAYTAGVFAELHAIGFMVGESLGQVKKRAKRELLQGTTELHTDDLLDVDDCLAIEEVEGLHVHLTHTSEVTKLLPKNGYHIIPRAVIAEFMRRNGLSP